MTLRSSAHSSRAAALLITLWAILVLAVCLLVLGQVVASDAGSESIASRRFVARQLALTGLALAQHPEVEPGDPLLSQKLDADRKFEVSITEESGRLDINRIATGEGLAKLRALFQFWGVSRSEAEVAADSIKDWIDPDDFRSLNGAERADIRPGSGYSRPANRPFRSVSELETVRGMDRVAAVFPAWKDVFTVNGSQSMSLQDAGPDLLGVFGGLGAEQVTALVRLRAGRDGIPGNLDDVTVESPQEAAKLIALDASQVAELARYFGARGSVKRITSRAWCAGVRYEITVVRAGEIAVVRDGENGTSAEVLNWLEN